jgi:hypothetical protein
VALGLAAGLGVGCVASPKPRPAEQPLPLERVDLEGWDRLLRHRVEEGTVYYPAFCSAPEFDALLDEIAAVDLSDVSPDERLSFLINAYNALAVSSILQGGSPHTLLGRYRFFLRNRHLVAGEAITLRDLEHERIRPLGEPRIHFALVCASTSCPQLPSEAFRPATLDAQLELAARRFVNDYERNRFYPGDGVAELSAIFNWYPEDFEDEESSLADYVARYVSDPAVAADLRAGRYELRFLPYDWALNGIPPSADGACP